MIQNRAYIIAGLNFGDEGKGTMVDFLCRKHNIKHVVRYNGGPQAAHHVVLPDGRVHAFSQFGSGMFIDDVQTHLSSYMLVEPYAFIGESEALIDKGVPRPLERITIDKRCVVITPFHWLANRIRESFRGKKRHGSTGMGVWEARSDSLHRRPTLKVMDLASGKKTWETLSEIKYSKLEEFRSFRGLSKEIDDLIYRMEKESTYAIENFYRMWFRSVRITDSNRFLKDAQGPTIFEGAQGVLLDADLGFEYPHVSATTTTFKNAEELIRGLDIEPIRIAVTRTYFTRHGAGPFPTENPTLGNIFPDKHNAPSAWASSMRFGDYDFELARYAIQCLPGLDGLALTHLDKMGSIYQFERELSFPVLYESHGETWEDKRITQFREKRRAV